MSSLVRGSRPGKQVQLVENEIKFLCTEAREIFINQPILLELEAPIKICGRSNEPVSTLSTWTLLDTEDGSLYWSKKKKSESEKTQGTKVHQQGVKGGAREHAALNAGGLTLC